MKAQIAQLVEQRTENPRVAGSIPALGTFLSLDCLWEKNKYLYQKERRYKENVFLGRNQSGRPGDRSVY